MTERTFSAGLLYPARNGIGFYYIIARVDNKCLIGYKISKVGDAEFTQVIAYSSFAELVA